MQLVDRLHEIVNGLSGWLVVLLVFGALCSFLIFVKVFESDFFNNPD